MSLYIEPLYEEAVRQFTSSVDDDRFEKSFIIAANRVFDKLSFQAGLSTAIAHIDSVQDTVSELDPKHSDIVMAGLSFYIAQGGQEHAQGVDAFDRLNQEWRAARNQYQVMKSWEDQETQDDDGVPTSDIAGLGYLGDD